MVQIKEARKKRKSKSSYFSFDNLSKSKKHPYDSITYTTGDPQLNIDHFNRLSGTALTGESSVAPESSEAAEMSSEAASGEGGLGESMNKNKLRIQEAKRKTKRYYIKPQRIFCANKNDIIKALIDIGNQNCSVYTLKNLKDREDLNKLTTHDIIYYYDDGILYDKNHVKVMDYDLFIKHEEERKKYASEPNWHDENVKDEYDDRLTKVTNFEEALSLDFDDYNAYGEKVDTNTCCICGEPIIGYGNNPAPYKSRGKCCDKCNYTYVLPLRIAKYKRK